MVALMENNLLITQIEIQKCLTVTERAKKLPLGLLGTNHFLMVQPLSAVTLKIRLQRMHGSGAQTFSS